MKDIVEEALNQKEDSDKDIESNPEDFEPPRTVLIGYGKQGREIAKEGLDERYPDPKYPEVTISLVEDENIEDLSKDVVKPDLAILIGSAKDQTLAQRVAENLPEETITIALPIARTQRRDLPKVDGTNIIIPCKPENVQRLTTDLMTTLTGRIPFSPPPQFYQELRLQTARAVQTFQGQQKRTDPDISEQELAERLVADTLKEPLYTGEIHNAENHFGFLIGNKDMTLGEAYAIREEIALQTGTENEIEFFCADVSKIMKSGYRLTLLVT